MQTLLTEDYGNYFLQELQRNIALCSQKLLRAEKLISGLGGERTRWTQVSFGVNKQENK